MIEFHQIIYDERQRSKLYDFAIPYFNEDLTIFFECSVIAKLVTESKADKIGVFSWKLKEKVSNRVGMRGPVTLEALSGDYEVLSLTRNSSRHCMLAAANAWHADFIPTITLLWEKLGYKIPREAKSPIYQNAFLGKREVYLDYVNNFLIPAMELTDTNEEVRNKMIQPSGYGRLNRHADLKRVKQKLGMDDYPLSCFILERCPALYFQMKGYKISYL